MNERGALVHLEGIGVTDVGGHSDGTPDKKGREVDQMEGELATSSELGRQTHTAGLGC